MSLEIADMHRTYNMQVEEGNLYSAAVINMFLKTAVFKRYENATSRRELAECWQDMSQLVAEGDKLEELINEKIGVGV